jgi:hypothetical protein
MADKDNVGNLIRSTYAVDLSYSNNTLTLLSQDNTTLATIVLPTLAVEYGGTGATSFTQSAVLIGQGTNAISASGVTIDSNNNVSIPGNLSVTGDATFADDVDFT